MRVHPGARRHAAPPQPVRHPVAAVPCSCWLKHLSIISNLTGDDENHSHVACLQKHLGLT